MQIKFRYIKSLFRVRNTYGILWLSQGKTRSKYEFNPFFNKRNLNIGNPRIQLTSKDSTRCSG